MTILAWIVFGLATASALLVMANVLFWPGARLRSGIYASQVSVLIPARNEEHRLGPCLDSVLAQGPIVGEVLVYDDHSTDGTEALIARYASRDARVWAIDSQPLPARWCGKNFACFRLAHKAQSPWILFLDADVRLAPGAISIVVSEAGQRQATMLSLWPRIIVDGFWERVLMPLLNFIVFSSYPATLALSRNDPSLGLAHGACILAHRDTYMAMGGHEVVRDEIFEDTRLARAWRAHGHRSICLDGQKLICVRMYESFDEIWRGFQKNFYTAFHSATVFWTFLLLHGLVFLAPFVVLPANLFLGRSLMIWAAIVGAIMFSRALLAIRFRQSMWTILFHPFAEILLLALGVSSWWHCFSGSGVVWKGRRYRGSESIAPR